MMMKRGYIRNIMSKKVSVIVPYNVDRGFLNNCVKSIENQSYPNVELILSQSNENVSVNFNRGLYKATGDLVKFVCEDDWLPEDAIENLVKGLGDGDWICANAYQVDNGQWVYKPGDLSFPSMVTQNQIHGGTTLYKMDLITYVGGLDESLTTGEEYDMHLKLYAMDIYPKYLDKEVYYHRLWSGQKSKILRTQRKKWRDGEIKRIQARYINAL